MDSSSDTSEKHHVAAHIVGDKDVDTAAQLAAGSDEHLDPEVAAMIKRKIDLHLMPLMCILYL
ncbi:hypothetical protein HGRIS_012957 [Hohenbuehelia grisea]|uniref:Uncharacterized protein n=1 Tax=Hohenbuehelia grisea TaxID=104357 RepID=A0ABR3IU39_9AGAR